MSGSGVPDSSSQCHWKAIFPLLASIIIVQSIMHHPYRRSCRDREIRHPDGPREFAPFSPSSFEIKQNEVSDYPETGSDPTGTVSPVCKNETTGASPAP